MFLQSGLPHWLVTVSGFASSLKVQDCCPEHYTPVLWHTEGVPINENAKDQRIANCQQSGKSYIVCNHGSMLTLGKVQTGYSNRKENSQLTCQHAHHRKQDLLYTLHRAPPLSTALIAHGIIAWGMQDGDANSPVRINCKSQRQPREPRYGASVLERLCR